MGKTFLVLLLLKVANHLTEQGLVLGIQWLRHDGGDAGVELTCASEESMCAGSGVSESDFGRTSWADKIAAAAAVVASTTTTNEERG